MSRTFKDKLRDVHWWLEQAIHFAVGAVIGLVFGWIASLWVSLVSAGFVALGAGSFAAATREMIQNLGDSDNDVLDAVADASFMTLGALAVAIPFWVVGEI